MARPRDDGFSLLEVLFAAFIAFFVLTAMFGVLVASTGEGRIANADTVATNLAQRTIEQARAMPYASVGMVDAAANEPPGLLPRSEDTTYQNLRFTIRRTVDWVDDRTLSPMGQGGRDYKKLTVQVSWVNGHTTPMYAFIRDTATDVYVPAPFVEWWHLDPSLANNNAVLFTLNNATRVWNRNTATPDGFIGGADVSLQASASVDTTAGSVARMEYWVGTTQIPGLVWLGAQPAIIFPDPLRYQFDVSQPPFVEGLNTVKVIAYSNTMSNAYAPLVFTIDNTPPNFPAGSVPIVGPAIWNQDRYNGALGATWTVPLDGGLPPTSYDITLTAYPSTNTMRQFQSLSASGTATFGRGVLSGFSVTPFSPYRLVLTPRSIRGVPGTPSSVSAWGISGPQLTGTLVNKASNQSNTDYYYVLSLSQPNASLASLFSGTSITYTLYRIDGAGYTYPGWGDLPDTATKVFSGQLHDKFEATPSPSLFATPGYWDSTGVNCGYYYQVEADVMSGTTVVARTRSNVIGTGFSGPIPKTKRDPFPPVLVP